MPNLRTTTAFLFGVVLLSVAALCDLRARWVDVPLEDVIKASPLVVVGEIKRINAAPKSDYSYDSAFIMVERVLKNTGTDKVGKAGSEILLAMPSENNKTHISTDIRYRKGQRGVWILEYHKGKYWATYPKDFQEISEESKIVEIIKKQASR